MRTIAALLIGLAVLGSSEAGWAQPNSGDGAGQQAAYGAGSVFSTLVYAPLKASFCILGAISSGFALPIAGPRTAGHIAGTTCGGSWVITPDNLKGNQPVKFVGGTS
jgi:hypothetical protein